MGRRGRLPPVWRGVPGCLAAGWMDGCMGAVGWAGPPPPVEQEEEGSGRAWVATAGWGLLPWSWLAVGPATGFGPASSPLVRSGLSVCFVAPLPPLSSCWSVDSPCVLCRLSLFPFPPPGLWPWTYWCRSRRRGRPGRREESEGRARPGRCGLDRLAWARRERQERRKGKGSQAPDTLSKSTKRPHLPTTHLLYYSPSSNPPH